MRTWRTRVYRLTTWLLVLGAVAAIVYHLALRPAVVRPHRLSLGPILVEALGTGSVESRRMVNVGFEVTGRITQLYVDQGDQVDQGANLAKIENSTFQAEVALAEQEVALSESTLSRLKADIERAQAVLKGAQTGLNRIRPLVAQHAASEETLDIAEERENVATAELARAQAAQLEGHEAISAARRKLDRAKAALDQTIVRSPFAGLVILREREVGDVAVPGATVLKLAATDTIWASVWVDETYLDSLAVGLPARIALRSEPSKIMTGTVSRVGREVDRETRELLVDVVFDVAPERLAFGQRVDLWIELARKVDVLRMPAVALVRVDGQQGAFIVDEGRARFRPLDLGLRGREFMEVVHGLSHDDIVLYPSYGKNKVLKNGQRIQLLPLVNGGERE